MIIYVATLKKKITFLQSKSFRNLCVSDTNDPYHDVHHYVGCRARFKLQYRKLFL